MVVFHMGLDQPPNYQELIDNLMKNTNALPDRKDTDCKDTCEKGTQDKTHDVSSGPLLKRVGQDEGI